MKLLVNEIFKSIQGEGLDIGRPCTMIRLTQCNLRCSYCDTDYAFSEGYELSIEDIVKKVKDLGCSIVEITGGEPLLQDNTSLLIKELLNHGYRVLIETNGSINIDILDKRCIKIMDIKTPSSKMDKFNLYSNILKLGNEDQVKFVVATKDDFSFACNVIKEINHNLKSGNIIFSPVTDILKPQILAGWIVESGLDVRMQVQFHKIIWPSNKRGV